MITNSVLIETKKIEQIIPSMINVINECSMANEEYVTFRFETKDNDLIPVVEEMFNEIYPYYKTESFMMWTDDMGYFKKTKKPWFIKVSWGGKRNAWEEARNKKRNDEVN